MVAKNFVFCRPPVKMNRTKKLKKLKQRAKDSEVIHCEPAKRILPKGPLSDPAALSVPLFGIPKAIPSGCAEKKKSEHFVNHSNQMV